MKTILIYLPNLNCGGAESVTVRLANFLAENGYSVKVVTALSGGALFELLDDRIDYLCLNLKTQWMALIKLPFVIRKFNPNVIFTTMKESNFILTLSRFFSCSNSRLIIREANTVSVQIKEERKLTQKIKNFIIGRSYHFADEIIALSEEIKTDLIKSFKISNNITVLPNPINFELLRRRSLCDLPDSLVDKSSTRLKIVTVARFYPQKNHLFLLSALSEYIKSYGPIELYLVGDGPQKKAIEEMADFLGILDSVIFMGFQKNPLPIVKCCDIFILPSLYEGFSNALLEAAALNKKILVSDSQSTSVSFLKKISSGMSYKNNDIDDFCMKLHRLSIDNIELKTDENMSEYEESIVFSSYLKVMCE